jgi:hypothetical protein
MKFVQSGITSGILCLTNEQRTYLGYYESKQALRFLYLNCVYRICFAHRSAFRNVTLAIGGD